MQRSTEHDEYTHWKNGTILAGKMGKIRAKKSIENNNVLIYLVNRKDEQIYEHYKKTMPKELKAERIH